MSGNRGKHPFCWRSAGRNVMHHRLQNSTFAFQSNLCCARCAWDRLQHAEALKGEILNSTMHSLTTITLCGLEAMAAHAA